MTTRERDQFGRFIRQPKKTSVDASKLTSETLQTVNLAEFRTILKEFLIKIQQINKTINKEKSIQDCETTYPDDHSCPMDDLLSEPLMASDGRFYDRAAIEKWLNRKTSRNNNESNFSLTKCIEQKEEMIKTLLEKIDNINISGTKATSDVIFDLKQEIVALKKQVTQQDEVIIMLKKQIIQQEEINLNLMKENSSLKLQQKENTINMNMNINIPSLHLDVKNFKKICSYEFDIEVCDLLELNDNAISCWTNEGVSLLKLTQGDNTLELIKKYFSTIEYNWTSPIKQDNGNIIYVNGWNNLTICDKNLNLIENFKELNWTYSLCNISEGSFAVGLGDGTLKIYSKKNNTGKYHVVKEYKSHSACIRSLLYLPKQNSLLSGTYDKKINVLNLTEGKNKKLDGHSGLVSSLILA
jgi:WD40 repeat protein